MKPKQLDIDPANPSTTGFDSGLTGAGPFTMTTQNSGDSLAHQVSLASTANLSGITMTLSGTDADRQPITEDVTGPNNNTVEGSKYFRTLTTVTASSTLGGSTMDVGFVDEVSSQTIPMDHYISTPATVKVVVTGTINYDVEETVRNPYPNLTDNAAPFTVTEQSNITWVNDANFTAKTTTTTDDLALSGVRAIRVVVNSYSNGAELQVLITQPY